MKEKLVVLIPAYNPTEDLIPLTKSLSSLKNIVVLVVNDGSKEDRDYIFSVLPENIVILTHEINMGKGEALKTGFRYIMESIPDCYGVVTADADGQHILEDIINVGKKLKEDNNSLILGSRLDINDMIPKSKFGNTITRNVFYMITHVKVFDTQTGLRGISYKYLDEFLRISGSRYEYEINMLLYATKNKIDIIEIPIHTIYIDNNSASSFNPVKDSIKIYKCLFRDWDRIKGLLYTISGILSFVVDFILFITINMFICSILSNEELSLLVSVVMSRTISSTFNFYINKKYVFKSNKNAFISLLEYYVLVIAVLAVNYSLLNILIIDLNFNEAISKLVVELSLFVISYFIQKWIVFKKK